MNILRIILDIQEKGDSGFGKEYFGKMALMKDHPRAATVTTLTDTQVWHLPRDNFKKLLDENLSLTVYFNRMISQRLKELQNI